MRAYAAKAFALGAVDKDGVSYRETLQGLIARNQNNPARLKTYQAELAMPDLPDALLYVWSAFCRLSARRSAGFSANPISFVEIDAFIRRAGVVLAPWEIRLIEDLDDLYRAEQNKPAGE